MKILVLIPARNEAKCIAAQITYLRALSRPQNCQIEIIVADGDSDDATRVLAESAGAHVLGCKANRGVQQNAAAQIANGDILWFLHADSKPHPRALEYLSRAARNPKTSGGNFRLHFETHAGKDKFWPRVFETIARTQRKRGGYYGDSGIWVRREVFQMLVGFKEWPLFEDFDFARRLEKFSSRHGMRTEYSPLEIIASARRFQTSPLRLLAQWIMLQTLFQIGVSPQRLARIYFGKTDL